MYNNNKWTYMGKGKENSCHSFYCVPPTIAYLFFSYPGQVVLPKHSWVCDLPSECGWLSGGYNLREKLPFFSQILRITNGFWSMDGIERTLIHLSLWLCQALVFSQFPSTCYKLLDLIPKAIPQGLFPYLPTSSSWGWLPRSSYQNSEVQQSKSPFESPNY